MLQEAHKGHNMHKWVAQAVKAVCIIQVICSWIYWQIVFSIVHTYIRYSAKHVVYLQAYQDNTLLVVVLQSRSIRLWLAGSFPKMAVFQARLFSAVILLTGCKYCSGWTSCKLRHPAVEIMRGELPVLCFYQVKDRFFESLTSSTLNYLDPKNRAVSMEQWTNCCKQKVGVDSWRGLMRQLKLFCQCCTCSVRLSKLTVCFAPAPNWAFALHICGCQSCASQPTNGSNWWAHHNEGPFYSWQEWTSSCVHENDSPRSIVHFRDLLSHFAPPLSDIELM